MKKVIVSVCALVVMGCSAPPPVSPPSPVSTLIPAVTPADEVARRVFFVDLADGAEVKSPIVIKMGVEGMEVKPAGEDVPNSGHHHLIVDGAFVTEGEAVPMDERHFHYGTGAEEATIELPPGEHTLTLQFADFMHRSYGEPMSVTIKVNVVD